jgi:hypothetical protein
MSHFLKIHRSTTSKWAKNVASKAVSSIPFSFPVHILSSIGTTPTKLSIFSKIKTPSPAKKKREQVTHTIFVYEIFGKIGEELLLLSVDFGNAFPIKDWLFQNLHFPMKFWTLQERKVKFDKRGMVARPKHFMDPYPLWVANGIAEDVDELKTNGTSMRTLIEEVKNEFQDKDIFFNGGEKRIRFQVTSVTAGPVIEEGLLALSDIAPEPAEDVEDVIDDATPIVWAIFSSTFDSLNLINE